MHRQCPHEERMLKFKNNFSANGSKQIVLKVIIVEYLRVNYTEKVKL